MDTVSLFSSREVRLAMCLGLLIWGTIGTGVGQTVSADSIPHQFYQVGVSASSVFKLLEEADPTRQYQLYGRYWATPNRMHRAALRYRHVVGEEAEVDVGLRVGVAWVFRADERWRFYGGGDVVTGYQRFANGNVSSRVGLSPLFGGLFFIGPHVSIALEPRLLATYALSRQNASGQSHSGVVSVQIEGAGLLILSVHF
jgi:hypothetical protein